MVYGELNCLFALNTNCDHKKKYQPACLRGTVRVDRVLRK
jgi:hypothetical protein